MRRTILRGAIGLLLCLLASAGLRAAPLNHNVASQVASTRKPLKAMKALATCRAAAAPSSMRSLPLSAQPLSVLPFLAKAGSPRICRNRKPSAEIKSAQDVLDDSLMDAMGVSQLQRRTVLKPSRHRYLKAWRTFVASSKVKVGRLAAKRLDKMMVTFFDVAFLRGEEADLGRDVLAAAAFLHPDAPKP